MDTSIIVQSSKKMMRVLAKNSPTILTALGVSGLISTVILAIKATPQAMEILMEEENYRLTESHDVDFHKPIEPMDVVMLTWKCYIPTALTGSFTIACMIAANNINLRRNAALASLLSIAETSLKEYQTKVVEKIGEKKEELIRGEIAQDHLDATPKDEKSVIISGNGDHLCFDSFSSRYFRSNIAFLQKQENLFNKRLLINDFLPINDFYYEIGLEGIELGDEFGWIAERNLLELKFTTKLKDDEPCLVLDYAVKPKHI